MSTNLALLRGFLANHPLAITPHMAEVISSVVERRAANIRLPEDELQRYRNNAVQLNQLPNGSVMVANVSADGDLLGLNELPGTEALAGGTSSANTGQLIAVINVVGILGQHSYQVEDISGPRGTSTDRISNAIRQAANDPQIGAIVLRVDSPGGSVFGLQTLSDTIHSVRGKKPIVAQADSVAASAAYWIASACDEIAVTPGGQVGSIGVLCLHVDQSAFDEKLGAKFTYIHAGERKVWGNPHEPLHDEALKSLQDSVDAYYTEFTRAVAKGRGVPVSKVLSDFGKGDMLMDSDAKAVGMVDYIDSLDGTVRRLSKQLQSGKRSGAKAEEENPHPVAEGDPETITAEADKPEAETTTGVDDAFRRRRHEMRRRAMGLT